MQIVEFYKGNQNESESRARLLNRTQLDTFQSHKAREYIYENLKAFNADYAIYYLKQEPQNKSRALIAEDGSAVDQCNSLFETDYARTQSTKSFVRTII